MKCTTLTIIGAITLAIGTYAKPNGHYQQHYQYKSSASSFHNNELQQRKDDQGYYIENGDLDGRSRPTVDSNSFHVQYVNPKTMNQNVHDIDGGITPSSYGNNAATQMGSYSHASSSDQHRDFSSDIYAPAGLKRLGQGLQDSMSRDLELALNNQMRMYTSYGYSSKPSQDDLSFKLRQELRQNLTRRLDDLARERYIQPHSQAYELQNLKQQLETNLVQQLQDGIATHYYQANTYPQSSHRPVLMHTPSNQYQQHTTYHTDASLTTMATGIQTKLNNFINSELDDLSDEEVLYNSRLLSDLQQQLRQNISNCFEAETYRNYGRINHNSPTPYNAQRLESLKQQVETNLVEKLNQAFRQKQATARSGVRVYQQPSPIKYTQQSRHYERDMSQIKHQMHHELSQGLNAALVRNQLKNQLSTSDVEEYQNMVNRLSMELNQNVSNHVGRELSRYTTNHQMPSDYSEIMDKMRRELQSDLQRELQSGMAHSTSSQYSASWSASNIRPITSMSHTLEQDCEDTNHQHKRLIKREASYDHYNHHQDVHNGHDDRYTFNSQMSLGRHQPIQMHNNEDVPSMESTNGNSVEYSQHSSVGIKGGVRKLKPQPFRVLESQQHSVNMPLNNMPTTTESAPLQHQDESIFWPNSNMNQQYDTSLNTNFNAFVGSQYNIESRQHSTTENYHDMPSFDHLIVFPDHDLLQQIKNNLEESGSSINSFEHSRGYGYAINYQPEHSTTLKYTNYKPSIESATHSSSLDLEYQSGTQSKLQHSNSESDNIYYASHQLVQSSNSKSGVTTQRNTHIVPGAHVIRTQQHSEARLHQKPTLIGLDAIALNNNELDQYVDSDLSQQLIDDEIPKFPVNVATAQQHKPYGYTEAENDLSSHQIIEELDQKDMLEAIQTFRPFSLSNHGQRHTTSVPLMDISQQIVHSNAKIDQQIEETSNVDLYSLPTQRNKPTFKLEVLRTTSTPRSSYSTVTHQPPPVVQNHFAFDSAANHNQLRPSLQTYKQPHASTDADMMQQQHFDDDIEMIPSRPNSNGNYEMHSSSQQHISSSMSHHHQQEEQMVIQSQASMEHDFDQYTNMQQKLPDDNASHYISSSNAHHQHNQMLVSQENDHDSQRIIDSHGKMEVGQKHKMEYNVGTGLYYQHVSHGSPQQTSNISDEETENFVDSRSNEEDNFNNEDDTENSQPGFWKRLGKKIKSTAQSVKNKLI